MVLFFLGTCLSTVYGGFYVERLDNRPHIFGIKVTDSIRQPSHVVDDKTLKIYAPCSNFILKSLYRHKHAMPVLMGISEDTLTGAMLETSVFCVNLGDSGSVAKLITLINCQPPYLAVSYDVKLKLMAWGRKLRDRDEADQPPTLSSVKDPSFSLPDIDKMHPNALKYLEQTYEATRTWILWGDYTDASKQAIKKGLEKTPFSIRALITATKENFEAQQRAFQDLIKDFLPTTEGHVEMIRDSEKQSLIWHASTSRNRYIRIDASTQG